MAFDAGVLEAQYLIAKHPEMTANCDCGGDFDVGVSFGGSDEPEDSNNGARATRPAAMQDESETGIAAHPVVAS